MKLILTICFAIACSLTLFAQTFITNVSILDVENQKLIPNQTVTITNDLISNIQSSKKVKTPEKATVIDGTGKFLIPGLTDAHIHLFISRDLY